MIRGGGKKWVTDTTEQYQYEVQQAENQRQSLLYDAERQLILLERKKWLEITTEREIVLLREWEIYSVKLTDINISIAPDIPWSEQPKSIRGSMPLIDYSGFLGQLMLGTAAILMRVNAIPV
ncbi:tail fiber assembly protein [Xenorhabdus bovienii]|uniref:tail fiber assembly protein n=1 Tax=Xenorhabdus bovienii TaxID=40576 RepID=UPI0023B2301B|nr:tail fiber assembly protein [Xenorhabdus bovienii]